MYTTTLLELKPLIEGLEILGPVETKLIPGNLLIEFDKFWLLIGLFFSKFNLLTLMILLFFDSLKGVEITTSSKSIDTIESFMDC